MGFESRGGGLYLSSHRLPNLPQFLHEFFEFTRPDRFFTIAQGTLWIRMNLNQ